MVDATIRSVERVGPSTVAVVLEPSTEIDGQPGQFVLLRTKIDGDVESGHYTISSPHVEDRLELTVGVDEDGTLGPWLQSASPGETVELEGPFGETCFEAESKIAILAQGPGIGPAVGLGEEAREADSEITIVYLNETVPHADRLDALEGDGATIHIVSDETEYAARLNEVLDDQQVYVFGFSPFVDETRDLLDQSAVPESNRKIEDFGPA